MKCIAIIPARIGSKSIKKKNLIKINGISIIEKTIHSLKKNKFLSCFAVSTDTKEIQKVAKKNNVVATVKLRLCWWEPQRTSRPPFTKDAYACLSRSDYDENKFLMGLIE